MINFVAFFFSFIVAQIRKCSAARRELKNKTLHNSKITEFLNMSHYSYDVDTNVLLVCVMWTNVYNTVTGWQGRWEVRENIAGYVTWKLDANEK